MDHWSIRATFQPLINYFRFNNFRIIRRCVRICPVIIGRRSPSCSFARSSSPRNKRARFRRSGTYIMRVNVWITRFQTGFYGDKGNGIHPRPSTKKQISIRSARAFLFEKRNKKKDWSKSLYGRGVTCRRKKPPFPRFCRFLFSQSNVRYLFRRACHAPVIAVTIRVTRLQFLSANLQSHANPRKIIFHPTPVLRRLPPRQKLVSSYFFRLTLFRRPDAKLWISGDCSGENSARF